MSFINVSDNPSTVNQRQNYLVNNQPVIVERPVSPIMNGGFVTPQFIENRELHRQIYFASP